jgi:hypothetical protein
VTGIGGRGKAGKPAASQRRNEDEWESAVLPFAMDASPSMVAELEAIDFTYRL